jgi:uncharacterized protein (AIM24 family)
MPQQPPDSALAGLACHIEDGATPYLAVDLEPGQTISGVAAALLWREPSVVIERGEGDTITLRGPGRVAFSRFVGGTLFPVPLEPDGAVQIAGDHMLLWFGTTVVAERIKGLGDRLTGGEGFRVDRVTAGGAGGVVWVQGAGDVFERGLIEGEMMDLRSSSFLCKDPAVRIENVFPLQGARSDLDLALLRCTGPGRIALQIAPVAVRVLPSPPPAAKRGLLRRL